MLTVDLSEHLLILALCTMSFLILVCGTSLVYADDTVVATIPVGRDPQGIAVDTINNMVYVVNFNSNSVSVIDGSNHIVVDTIPVQSRPFDAAFNPLNECVYVTNAASNTVSVIDTRTRQVIDTISVGTSPFAITFNQANDEIYIANAGSGDVNAIDSTTNTMIATIPAGISPQGIAANSEYNKIYVTTNGAVYVIDGKTKTVISTIEGLTSPVGVTINTDNDNVYVTDVGTHLLLVIDPSTDSVKKTIGLPSPSRTYGIDYNSFNRNLYIGDTDSNKVYVVDTLTDTLISTVLVGNNPFDVAFNPNNQHIYTSDSGQGTVSVILASRQSPIIVIEDLIRNIKSMDTNNNVKKSLLSTLRPALDILSDSKSKNDQSACRNLNVFVIKVEVLYQSHRLSESQSEQLVDMADLIIETLECDPLQFPLR